MTVRGGLVQSVLSQVRILCWFKLNNTYFMFIDLLVARWTDGTHWLGIILVCTTFTESRQEFQATNLSFTEALYVLSRWFFHVDFIKKVQALLLTHMTLNFPFSLPRSYDVLVIGLPNDLWSLWWWTTQEWKCWGRVIEFAQNDKWQGMWRLMAQVDFTCALFNLIVYKSYLVTWIDTTDYVSNVSQLFAIYLSRELQDALACLIDISYLS